MIRILQRINELGEYCKEGACECCVYSARCRSHCITPLILIDYRNKHSRYCMVNKCPMWKERII